MSRWFRSEEMEYVSLIVNEDAAHQCLTDLGKLGVVQFTDLNPDLTRFSVVMYPLSSVVTSSSVNSVSLHMNAIALI